MPQTNACAVATQALLSILWFMMCFILLAFRRYAQNPSMKDHKKPIDLANTVASALLEQHSRALAAAQSLHIMLAPEDEPLRRVSMVSISSFLQCPYDRCDIASVGVFWDKKLMMSALAGMQCK